MNFSVTGPHRQFFRTHQWIECEALLSAPELKKAQQEVAVVIQQRSIKSDISSQVEKNFILGRDVWRESSSLKKIFLQKGFGEIAAGLIEVPKIRFGFDQYLTSFIPTDEVFSNQPFLNQLVSLKEVTSIQSPLCGAMFCLSAMPKEAAPASEKSMTHQLDIQDSTPNQSSPCQLFSSVPGNAVFFSPDLPIDFSLLKQNSNASYVLVVYVTDISNYYKQELDPHGNALKKLKYNMGDRLKEHLHPTIYS